MFLLQNKSQKTITRVFLKPVDAQKNACTTKLKSVVHTDDAHEAGQKIEVEYEYWKKNGNNTTNKIYNSWEEACANDKAKMKKACELVINEKGLMALHTTVPNGKMLCEMAGLNMKELAIRYRKEN